MRNEIQTVRDDGDFAGLRLPRKDPARQPDPAPEASHSEPALQLWIGSERPDKEVLRSLDRLRGLADAVRIAVMPDVHAGASVCNGVVLATRSLIYPEAVGGDIGCGYAALRFDASADLLKSERAAGAVLERLYLHIPFLKQPHPIDLGEACEPVREISDQLAKTAEREGRYQLGTLGRGNHFIEFQRDQEGALWVLVHSGSRAVGQAVLAHHLQRAESGNGGPACLQADTEQGQAYLRDADFALRYAARNRELICQQVAAFMDEAFAISVDPASAINTPHNFLRQETHDGVQLFVHRKSVNSAKTGELNVIPGSVGSKSFIVEGRGCAAALCSSSHGAGRALSRGEAFHKVSVRELERLAKRVWFDQRHMESMRDEAPSAYRDINAVMAAQRELVKQVAVLEPVLNYKAPGDRPRAAARRR